MIIFKNWVRCDLTEFFVDSKPMEMAYFEEAIDLLQKKTEIKSDKGLGICGISKGGDIALTLASILPPEKLGAIAVMNTLISSAVVGTKYKGKTVSKGRIDPFF